ncbi:Neuropeptide-Like Protein [Caenorhabditis elegans]|uniref:Neuropeptide-Like Protein n=1 Tax=Caenorhabditis elegans TaxID=6239 RepID=A8WFM8_CAEEL|nr:Neuropeptide-Like Protein [Caenorhabditis elegans]CCD70189.1 Neuropeptide-Like Protein [Caenorhabditis elegans]|eukprot:NP_500422.3 Uncharacterized protein CELE_F28F9.3 [Caenorhabditis elegans]
MQEGWRDINQRISVISRMLARLIALLIVLVAFATAWTVDGVEDHLPEHQYSRGHEANFFRQRLLSAFRSIDPQVSESTLNRFTRFVREENE